MLSVRNLTAYYGDFQALFGIDCDLREREIVALIGANGAGKSTFLKSLCGELPAPPGTVRYDDATIDGLTPDEIVARGIAMVPEGRRLFPSLTVEENLRVGGFAGRSGQWSLERVYALFPELDQCRHRRPATLSGGQQQMTAIGRALLSNPRVLLCDEVSLGLAPIVVATIYEALTALPDEGLSVIIVEQDIDTALRVADRAYCFMHGRVSLEGAVANLTRAEISKAYFGL